MDGRQKEFIGALTQEHGLIVTACKSMGISTGTFYNWKKKSPEFADAVKDVLEEQTDFVESKLRDRIEKGDTTAIIFYLKTKGKDRGYGSPAMKSEQDKQIDKENERKFAKLVANKKSWLVRLLKKQGKYSPELTAQAKLTAILMVKMERLSVRIAVNGSINVEVSREGNERQQVSPEEKLFMAYSRQLQYALRALGMNTDSHALPERDEDGSVDGFLEALNSSVE